MTTPAMFIIIRTQFEGMHRWKDAPDSHKYLRNWHRHMFHVEISKEVGHGNRQIEFHAFKAEVENYIRDEIQDEPFEMSCEQIAANLLNKFDAAEVSVFEDGENGGRVYKRNSITTDGIEKFMKDTARENKQTDRTIEQLAAEIMEIKNHLVSEKQQEAKQAPADEKKVNDVVGSIVKSMFGFCDNLNCEQCVVANKKKEESVLTKLVTKPFTGIEAEGPLKGTDTVFVPCVGWAMNEKTMDMCLAQLMQMMEIDKKNVQLYVGAGNMVYNETIPYVTERRGTKKFLIDHLILSFNTIAAKIEKIRIAMKWKKRPMFHLTIETENLAWFLTATSKLVSQMLRDYEQWIKVRIITPKNQFKSEQEFEYLLLNSLGASNVDVLLKTVDEKEGTVSLQNGYENGNCTTWLTHESDPYYKTDKVIV